jgi:hypothetical protein
LEQTVEPIAFRPHGAEVRDLGAERHHELVAAIVRQTDFLRVVCFQYEGHVFPFLCVFGFDFGNEKQEARHRHFGIAELLESRGARPKPMDFQTCCEKLDLFMMERHLRAGTDLNQDNVFAQALSSMKARPLLGFYRQFRGEFPALDDQAALALAACAARPLAVRLLRVVWPILPRVCVAPRNRRTRPPTSR